jgi:outer membrane protein assembly factor BamA
MRRFFVLVILLSLSASALKAQEEGLAKLDTLGKNKKLQVVVVPILFSTPETGFGAGAGAQFFFLEKSNIYNSRLSNVFTNAIYTSNNQFILDIKPQIYFNRGDFFLDGAYKYKIYPNSFWGIGLNTPDSNKEIYDMVSTELRVALLKRLPPKLNFGFEFVYQNHEVTEKEEGGLLDAGDILGSNRAIISGLGVIFNLDSRDQLESPKSGYLVQMNARFSSEVWGGTSSFNKYIADLRAYFPIAKNGTFAAQFYNENSFGTIPFQGMAWYGGGDRARGYFKGRFIDNHMYVIQAEYRHQLTPRWSAAGFALMGEVSDLPRDYLNDIKPSFGGGIRFKIIKNQNTLVRLDMAFGKDGSSGFYFGVNEAF